MLPTMMISTIIMIMPNNNNNNDNDNDDNNNNNNNQHTYIHGIPNDDSTSAQAEDPNLRTLAAGTGYQQRL